MNPSSIVYITGLTLFVAFGCSSGPDPIIMTVRGPVPAGDMGIALTHEHVLVDFIGADSTGLHRWDKDQVEQVVLPFLEEIRERDVKTIVECTPAYLGRDPLLLRSLSRKSGLNILTNTGYYGAVQNKYLPEHFYGMSEGELADLWTLEFEKGIEGTGVRPGFIKISVGPDDTLSKEHVK
ncbi:MAG: phosphotriesterase, partial [Bacteroidetes bacterium]